MKDMFNECLEMHLLYIYYINLGKEVNLGRGSFVFRWFTQNSPTGYGSHTVFFFLYNIFSDTCESVSPLSIAESFPLGIGNMAPHDALQLHKRKVVNSSSQSILINRNSQLTIRDLFKKLKRKQLDIAKVPDITFIGEEGIDADGLTKEFLALVTRALSDGSGGYILFEGGQDHLVPIISEEFHQSSYFRYVGELIAMSVLHSGLGMVGVSRAVTNFIITDDMEMASCHLTVEDVPDYNIQQAITEVKVHFAL